MFRACRRFSAIAAATAVVACVSSAPQDLGPLAVIPAPADVEAREGTFVVSSDTPLIVPEDESVERVARQLSQLLARTRKLTVEVRRGEGPAPGAIALRLDPSLQGVGAEGYTLSITPQGVVVAARDLPGLFYGGVTLWQLITAEGQAGPARLASLSIRDAPRFRWRGFMLDVARHYMPPEFVKELIDWMALHKLNTLHWHLTDDQGWRLEVLKYPRLTEVGAWRVPAGAASAGGRYGGYYTQGEVRDIVRHAAERFVTIVPELDVPGHAQAAIAAYPRLGTEADPPAVSADWGIHDWLFNVEEDTFAFIEDVLTEMIGLFPGEYIHVGGDEAVKTRWKASPRVQERMRELGIADETALQAWFVNRLERFLRSRGRQLIGWDEILEGGLSPGAAVMSWRGPEGAIEAARAGHPVVMATMPTLYLDYLQSDSPDEPPGRPAYVTLEDVYRFEPVPDGLSEREAGFILGAQLNAWTEHMRTPGRIEHNTFPKLAAVAELLWSPRSQRDWKGFVARLPAQLARYEALGIGYADSAFAPRFDLLHDRGSLRLQLANQVDEGEIRYTLDGSEPGSASPLYDDEPLPLLLPATVRAATFLRGRRVGASRIRTYDTAESRRRTDEALQTCERKLVLRLEDDAPATGERAVFNVDIMDPCWIFEDAELSGVARIAATVGQLPFNFQIGEDVHRIPLRTPQSPAGELEIRLGDCDGERIAILPLAPAVARHELTALPPVPIAPRSGTHDLCLTFTRAALEPMWALDRVELLE